MYRLLPKYYGAVYVQLEDFWFLGAEGPKQLEGPELPNTAHLQASKSP